QVNQPKMKVFTVGLDDKEKSLKADAEKADHAKIDVPLTGPPPIIIPQAPPKRRFGCGALSWVVAAFFVVLLCLTISEITYNRQRDQAFLTLKWAELRQRMLGFEILSQAQQQTRGQVQQSVNELRTFPRRHDSSTTTTTAATTTEEAFSTKSTETSNEGNDNELSSKFDLLRMILSKMRENAEEMGITGDVQVHVIELKPFNNDKMPQQSIDDAFGEVAFPKRVFGPWRNEESYNDIRGNIELPWQFDRGSMRPSPWSRPADRSYQWEGSQEPRWQQDNQVLYPVLDAPDRDPQARLTPHFEKENQASQRFLTEPFGNNAPEVIGHILGQKNAQAHMQLQQQQMQQQQWPQPWPQTPALQWPQPQPWPQVSGWEQRWDQPQQAQNPMIWPPVFFSQMPSPLQQPPFQPQP
ncbi:hypothetical protein Angca_001820, partial [Angiostrongylus cantonensis]